MDWLETWRDSWSTGSATAASSSSSPPSSEGAPNANDDTRAAAPENGKKRKHKIATAASSPSEEPRRTKRVRKPTAALAEFRIELSTRRNRTGLRPDDDAGGDSEQLLIPTRRARTRVRQSTVSGDELSTTTAEYALNRYSTRTNPALVGDDVVFGTSENGNTMLQVEETAVGTLNQRKQRILWTPAEDARLRTAILTFAGLDPTTTDISVGHVKVKTSEWPEVKRIFDALAPPESAASGPPRSVHSLQGHFYTALLRRSQRAPPVTVPAEAGPSPSGSHSPVSPAPSLSAVGSSSATPGTNLVEEAPQRADRSATDSGQDERREESAPPNQAVAVESFDSAAATAFFPGSDVPMSGSLRLEDVLTALTTAGSATAPATTSSLDAAAAQPGNLDSSTPRPGHSDATLSPEEHGHFTGHIPGAEGSPEAADGTNFGRSQEPSPTSEAGGTPEAGTSGAVATGLTSPGNVNSASSASAGSGAQPAGTGGKATGFRHFTAAEDARIIELFSSRTPKTHIARALNRSYSSLWQRVNLLRQRGMITQPLPAASPSQPPPEHPAIGASVPSTDTPSVVTKDAQHSVAGSSHSATVPASSSSMVVPSSQARVDDPQVGQNPSDANPAPPQNGPDKKATAPKRFSAEEDQQIVELRASGIDWQKIGSRLQRTKAACGQRYARLKEKAQLAGKDLSSFVQLPKPVAAGGQAGEAFTAPPPISSTPAQQPTATTAPLPPYTVEDDSIILRMYLQGNSAERIGVAIKRSGFSVHRRWNKKKDGWIAAGLLTAGSRLKLHDDPPDQPIVSAATKSPVDPFADLRAPPTSSTSVQQEKCGPIGSSASCTPTLETETAAENDLGGFDASFWSNDDMAIDPALLNIGADWPSGPASKAAYSQPQDPAVASLGIRQQSPLVPTTSKQDSSTPEMAAEKMLAGAMPHYDSGMQGLNRFLRLVDSGGKKKC